MEGLKKCPFCSSKAVFYQYSTNCDDNSMSCYFQIRCSKCGATTSTTFGRIRFRLDLNGDIFFVMDERQKAIEIWNKRR